MKCLIQIESNQIIEKKSNFLFSKCKTALENIAL
jgi:hypothetical protein